MTGPIPNASTPITGAGGLPNRVWYAFFSQMHNGTSDPVARAQIETILQRLDALENEADAAGLIMGLDSVQVSGTLADGLVSVTLRGDVDKPGNTYVYGTGPDGVKGWYLLGDAFDTATLAKVVDPDTGIVSFDLAELADTGTGAALVKITRDGYGRVEGTESATTDDLPEGATNLYYTDARADARIEVQKGQPLGLATLDANSKLDAGQLPALAITETFVVNTEAAMLALDCQQGDVAVRSDLQASFILTAEPASTLSNWQELLVPTGVGVASFNGRTGSVVPASGDYTFAQIASTPTTLSGYGITDAATSAQGVKADTAVQPGDLSDVATSGDYDDLSNLPTLGTAAAADASDFVAKAGDTMTGSLDLAGGVTILNDGNIFAFRGVNPTMQWQSNDQSQRIRMRAVLDDSSNDGWTLHKWNGTGWVPFFSVATAGAQVNGVPVLTGADSGWVVPTLLNGWTNYGGIRSSIGIRKVGNRVYLRGTLKDGALTDGTNLFEMPVGYRPPSGQTYTLPVSAGGAAGGLSKILVGPSGSVLLYSATGATYFSLDGLSFFTD